MFTIYGIRNCNTVKKSVDWLNANNIPFEFHDYKKSGISKRKLENWCKQISWNLLLNQKGITWRNLDAERKTGITDETGAIEFMLEKTSVIKRPLIENNEGLIVAFGFNEEEYEKVFAST